MSHLRFPGIQAGFVYEWRLQRFGEILCPGLSTASSSWECGDGAEQGWKALENAFKTSEMPLKMFNSLFNVYSCTLSAGLAMIIQITIFGQKIMLSSSSPFPFHLSLQIHSEMIPPQCRGMLQLSD